MAKTSSDSLAPFIPRQERGYGLDDLIDQLKIVAARSTEVDELESLIEQRVPSVIERQLANPAKQREAGSPSRVLNYVAWRKGRVSREAFREVGSRETREAMTLPDIEAAESNRRAFLVKKEKLLADYRGMFVAFIAGSMVASSTSFDRLVSQLRDNQPSEDVYIEFVEEAAFEDTGCADMPGLHEMGSES